MYYYVDLNQRNFMFLHIFVNVIMPSTTMSLDVGNIKFLV